MAYFDDRYQSGGESPQESRQSARDKLADLATKNATRYREGGESARAATMGTIGRRQKFQQKQFQKEEDAQQAAAINAQKTWGDDVAAGAAAGSSFGPWGALAGAAGGTLKGIVESTKAYEDEGYNTGDALTASSSGLLGHGVGWDPVKGEVQTNMMLSGSPESNANVGAVGNMYQTQMAKGGAKGARDKYSDEYADLLNKSTANPDWVQPGGAEGKQGVFGDGDEFSKPGYDPRGSGSPGSTQDRTKNLFKPAGGGDPYGGLF